MSILFAPLSLNVVRGMTWSELITIKNNDGTVVDLTGVLDIVMRVRKVINTTTALIEMSKTNGRILVISAALGQIQLLVTGDDTRDNFPSNNNLKATYPYDSVIIRPGTPQIREPGSSGKVRVKPQVTRPWELVTP